jgi:hypothetical protein
VQRRRRQPCLRRIHTEQTDRKEEKRFIRKKPKENNVKYNFLNHVFLLLFFKNSHILLEKKLRMNSIVDIFLSNYLKKKYSFNNDGR